MFTPLRRLTHHLRHLTHSAGRWIDSGPVFLPSSLPELAWRKDCTGLRLRSGPHSTPDRRHPGLLSREGVMDFNVRSGLSLLCSELLLLNLLACGGHRVTLPEVKPVAPVFGPLQEDLKKSYATLFEIAPTLEYSDAQIATMQEYLRQAQDYCTGRFESVATEYQRRVDIDQAALKKSTTSDEERHNLHCRIQEARALKSQADVIGQHAIPVAYENKLAKLELIQKWPAQVKE